MPNDGGQHPDLLRVRAAWEQDELVAPGVLIGGDGVANSVGVGDCVDGEVGGRLTFDRVVVTENAVAVSCARGPSEK